jgi:hypothetical protein
MADPSRTGQLRCVAPIVTPGNPPKLVGACTLVTNGERVIAFSSAELLRKASEPIEICTRLDGSSTIAVTGWHLGRRVGLGILELAPGAAFTPEVHPLHLGSVHATLDTRGAPSALVTFRADGAGFVRHVIAVHVDNADPSGMSDDITWLASPDDAADEGIEVDGAPLFTWMPPDPVLGRPSEVVVVALGLAYRVPLFKPRAHAPLAELVGLDDLGRALPWAEHTPPPSTALGQVAGEIRDDASAPIVVGHKSTE